MPNKTNNANVISVKSGSLNFNFHRFSVLNYLYVFFCYQCFLSYWFHQKLFLLFNPFRFIYYFYNNRLPAMFTASVPRGKFGTRLFKNLDVVYLNTAPMKPPIPTYKMCSNIWIFTNLIKHLLRCYNKIFWENKKRAKTRSLPLY